MEHLYDKITEEFTNTLISYFDDEATLKEVEKKQEKEVLILFHQNWKEMKTKLKENIFNMTTDAISFIENLTDLSNKYQIPFKVLRNSDYPDKVSNPISTSTYIDFNFLIFEIDSYGRMFINKVVENSTFDDINDIIMFIDECKFMTIDSYES